MLIVPSAPYRQMVYATDYSAAASFITSAMIASFVKGTSVAKIPAHDATHILLAGIAGLYLDISLPSKQILFYPLYVTVFLIRTVIRLPLTKEL